MRCLAVVMVLNRCRWVRDTTAHFFLRSMVGGSRFYDHRTKGLYMARSNQARLIIYHSCQSHNRLSIHSHHAAPAPESGISVLNVTCGPYVKLRTCGCTNIPSILPSFSFPTSSLFFRGAGFFFCFMGSVFFFSFFIPEDTPAPFSLSISLLYSTWPDE